MVYKSVSHLCGSFGRIENLEKSNEGMYICRATTLFGQAQDTAKLTIQGLSTSRLVLWTRDYSLNPFEHRMPLYTGTSGYKL